ncbi:MAG TPA: tripartite tricarboxylate transporter TctB family protein [Bacillota bacterium]|nr:tripartite tricarboxylate transporter TctB family protein [Bacillota bacterium]HPU95321.1 tripartite tricarboxylate transporter TctB family protein [Bacillota bacterium]
MRRTDTIFGMIIIAVAGAFAVMSLMMPWDGSEWGVIAAPGLVPLILSILLMITGLTLLLRAVLSKGFYKSLEEQKAAEADDNGCEKQGQSERLNKEPAWKRILMTIGLSAAYIFVLLGRLPYMVSTGLFVAGFIFTFKGGGIVKSVLIGAFTSVGVWLVFEKVFLVALP